MTNQSQKAWVYAQLKRGRRLTPVKAFDGCGTMRLAAIIHDLRAEGHSVITVSKYIGGKQFAEYFMPKGKK